MKDVATTNAAASSASLGHGSRRLHLKKLRRELHQRLRKGSGEVRDVELGWVVVYHAMHAILKLTCVHMGQVEQLEVECAGVDVSSCVQQLKDLCEANNAIAENEED